MRVLYGSGDTRIDVTAEFFAAVCKAGTLSIPVNDFRRLHMFACKDPLPGVLKSVWVEDDFDNKTCVLSGESAVFTKLRSGKVLMRGVPLTDAVGRAIVADIHASLSFRHGRLEDEFPEQCLIARYVPIDGTVLEIGANVGRSTMILSALLRRSRNLVTLESAKASVDALTDNCEANGFDCFIEHTAISKKPLRQQWWVTKPEELCTEAELRSWSTVPTMTFEALKAKYTPVLGPFTVLVADCEGALFHIVQDEPSFFDTFTTVIVENDYTSSVEQDVVAGFMTRAGLRCIESQTLYGDKIRPGFFEVWRRA